VSGNLHRTSPTGRTFAARSRPVPLQLALGEVIAHKAAYGRQLAVRSSGGGCVQVTDRVGLGGTKQSACEGRRICRVQEKVPQRENSGCEGLDELEAV
jgi:hypothetical protein